MIDHQCSDLVSGQVSVR